MWMILCVSFLAVVSGIFSSQTSRFERAPSLHSPSSLIASPNVAALHFEAFGLHGKLSFEVFEMAYEGYLIHAPSREDRLTIVDFSKPSTEKRMWVLDMKNNKILYHTIVSHGRNSGDTYAKKFSNIHGSFQSSLGFYKTAQPYQGSNGYSMVLEGLEKGINDQAKARAVVMHGADYCSEEFIKRTGRLGRSYGCPALPRAINKKVIDDIKLGSILFIYAPDPSYLANSTSIKSLREEKISVL